MFYKPYNTLFILFGFIAALLLQFPAYAQADRKIKIAGPSLVAKHMFFVGEIHSINEKEAFYAALAPYLATQHNVHDVVLETGHADAYLLNKYLHDGDTAFYVRDNSKEFREFMKELRVFNDTQPETKKIRMHGMDFERMEMIVATRKILEGNDAIYGTEFYKYIFAVHDSVIKLVHMTKEAERTRKKLYAEMKELFAKEKEALRKGVKKDFETLELIFENPTEERKFSRRDKGMYRNIKNQLQGKPFLCIVGSYHIWYRRGEVYPSLVKRLTKHNRKNRQGLVIIDEVRNGKYRVQELHSHEWEPIKYKYGKAGPEYFTKNDSAMTRGYNNYFKPDSYTLANRELFNDLVHKSNHGFDSYYVFFGEWPPKQ